MAKKNSLSASLISKLQLDCLHIGKCQSLPFHNWYNFPTLTDILPVKSKKCLSLFSKTEHILFNFSLLLSMPAQISWLQLMHFCKSFTQTSGNIRTLTTACVPSKYRLFTFNLPSVYFLLLKIIFRKLGKPVELPMLETDKSHSYNCFHWFQ